VLPEQIAKRLLGNLLDALHLITRQKIDRVPGFAIELQPLADEIIRLARHFPFLLHRALGHSELRSTPTNDKNLICENAHFIELKHAIQPPFTRKIRTSPRARTLSVRRNSDPRRCDMLKIMTGIAAVAAVTLTLVAAPQEAQARWRHHHGGGVAAGIIGGLAAGAIIGSAANGYYGPGYYGPAYAYGPPCYWSRERVWTGWGWRWHRVRVCN
jgi:hypothetical protein